MTDEKTFKVNDRRGRSDEDEPVSQESTKNDLPKTGEIDFSSFVLSLSTSALIHLGEAEDPSTNEVTIQLTVAKGEIQILEMLESRTKGNLTEQEERLMNDVLYHLRMKFIEKAGS